jgi:hypothetical protein
MHDEFAPPKLPRLHDSLTLEEAADWLSQAGSEQWSPRAVLAALCETKTCDAEGFMQSLLPEAITLVVPAGSLLVDPFTGERGHLDRARTYIVGGEYRVQDLLQRFLDIGHAEAVSLKTWHGTQRLLCESRLSPDGLRLSADLVQSLLPAFDALVLGLKRGEHPDLARIIFSNGEQIGVSERDTQQEQPPQEMTVPTSPTDQSSSMPPVLPKVIATKTDLGLLANPTMLIDAFGRNSGMSQAWFKNLKDSPPLERARKIKGSGGRRHTRDPWFCPYEVMKWLCSGKCRKSGARHMTRETGWRLLKTNFSRVYLQHEMEAPVND